MTVISCVIVSEFVVSLGDNINRLSGDKKIGCQVTRDLSGDNMEKAFVGCQVTT